MCVCFAHPRNLSVFLSFCCQSQSLALSLSFHRSSLALLSCSWPFSAGVVRRGGRRHREHAHSSSRACSLPRVSLLCRPLPLPSCCSINVSGVSDPASRAVFVDVQRLTSLHTHIAWDMDDGGYTTQAEQDGPYGSNDWHCKLKLNAYFSSLTLLHAHPCYILRCLLLCLARTRSTAHIRGQR